tara:strand:- start:40193 stop:40765 length:573 start_codon:yes stop_codon:yes gene_type:complete
MVPVLVAPPLASPVPTPEMKTHLRIDFADDDDHIEGLIAAATAHLDGYDGILGRCLITQTWAISLEGWPWCTFRLPFPQVSSVVLKFLDASGVEQEVDASDYQVVEMPLGTEVRFNAGFERPQLFDQNVTPVTATMVAGYGGADAVPPPIKTAIMMMAAHWYEKREAASGGSEMPFGVNALIAPYRRVGP